MVTQTPTQTADSSSRSGDGVNESVREHYRSLLCRLDWPGNGASPPLRTLGITSCRRGEGVSTVAWQLAATAASIVHHQVLLVDANLRSPSAERRFNLAPGEGLAEVLLYRRTPLKCIRSTLVRGLSVLTAGRSNGRASEAYGAVGLSSLFETLKNRFELVVFDLPSTAQSGLAVRWAAHMDGVLLVVEAERVRREVVGRAIEDLRRANVPLLGAVLNKRRQHVPEWLYRTL